MAFEFDHLFICTDIGAAECDRLISSGLIEGSSSIHPGQGTANRRFFFHNAMLELLWVDDRQEALSEPIRRTHLWERWENRDRGACPFGICLRPTAESKDTVAFPSWAYCPPYLPETLSIAVGNNSEELHEPMVFQIPFGQRPDQYSLEKLQPLNHTLGVHEITRVEVITPVAQKPSAELQAVVDTKQIMLRHGAEYCVEFGFDRESQGQHLDFRPGLPLVMRW